MAARIVYKNSNAKHKCVVCGGKIPEQRAAIATGLGMTPTFCSREHKDVQHQRDLRAARKKKSTRA